MSIEESLGAKNVEDGKAMEGIEDDEAVSEQIDAKLKNNRVEGVEDAIEDDDVVAEPFGDGKVCVLGPQACKYCFVLEIC